VIHCIWLGSNEIPDYLRPCIDSWQKHHPTWKLELWRDDTLPPLSCQAEFEQARFKVRYDIARYEILRQLGGVIVDMDMEAVRPVDPLLDGVVAFCGRYSAWGRIGSQMLGAVPHHPFFEEVVERLRGTVGHASTSDDQAGPGFLTRAAAEYDGGDLTIFPSETFYSLLTIDPPRRPDAFPDIYAVHHHLESWRKHPDARVLTLERRLRDTQRALSRERKRSRKLAKRLSRLEKQAEEPSD
jgi:hypothetical protein